MQRRHLPRAGPSKQRDQVLPREHVADRAVCMLFRDICAARAYHCLNDAERERMRRYERDAWKYLMQYLTTLEVPDFVLDD